MIAMSGGVDSSVAALLMKEAGYECAGVTMRLFRETKYIGALKERLDELEIPYKVDGPFPKHLSRHVLP